MSWKTELVVIAENGGLGTYNQTVFVGRGPRQPIGDDKYLSVIPTTGSKPDWTAESGDHPAYQNPTAQIVARAKRPSDAWTLAEHAYDVYCAVHNEYVYDIYAPSGYVNSTWYLSIRPMNEPNDVLGIDDKDYFRVSFNIMARKRFS